MAIHPTAVVALGAEIHETVEVGPYAVIGPKVRIGAGSTVGSHSVIEGRTTIGEVNRIFHHASVGSIPQDLKYAGEDSTLEIGDRNIVREFATLHIGTTAGGGATRVGSGNLFMANSHVAHDCRIGDQNVFANSATLAGHVTIGSQVTLGGLSAVHQFTRIGDLAFIAGGSMVAMDVAPFCMVQGDRAELVGLNTVGMTRHGYSEEQISHVNRGYQLLFRSKLGLGEACDVLNAELGSHPEVKVLLAFVANSKRGVTR